MDISARLNSISVSTKEIQARRLRLTDILEQISALQSEAVMLQGEVSGLLSVVNDNLAYVRDELTLTKITENDETSAS